MSLPVEERKYQAAALQKKYPDSCPAAVRIVHGGK